MPRLLGTTVEGSTVERGSTVSLNMRRKPYLGVHGFCVSTGTPTAVVPDNLDEAALSLLRQAHDAGFLVLGRQPIFKEGHLNALQPIYEELDAANKPQDIARTLHQLAIGKKKIPHLNAAEAIRRVLHHEIDHHCRDEFINWMANIGERIAGPLGVVESSQDQQEVQLGMPPTMPGQGEVGSVRTMGEGLAGAQPEEPKTQEQQTRINELF